MALKKALGRDRAVKCGVCGIEFDRLGIARHRAMHTDAERRRLKEEYEKGVRDAYKIRG